MERWSSEQRATTVKLYYETQSIIQTQRNFRNRFQVPRRGRIPTSKTILSWIHKFARTGSVLDEKHGRPRSVRTQQNVERVREAVRAAPRLSVRRQALELGLSRRSTQRIMRELKLHPYKLQIVQKLHPQDRQNRVLFCNTMLHMLNETPDIINLLMMSDEAHFHLSGYVNKQNMRFWSTDNPRDLHEQPLHSPKVTVWCGVTRSRIIGPYFFEEGNRTVTVTAERYVNMLQHFVIPELHRIGVDSRNVYLQQDGATAHTARISMAVVRETFGHVISRFGQTPWPARSPDLTVPDFFLWGYLKQQVFRHRYDTLQELKESIRNEIRLINQELLNRVFENFINRLRQCAANNGSHLTDVIFRT